MTEDKIHKVGRIDQIVRDYFISNPLVKEIQAKELMNLFIEKGIFSKNHRNGLPIRNLLRELDSENKLLILNNVRVFRNIKNRNWYFTRKP